MDMPVKVVEIRDNHLTMESLDNGGFGGLMCGVRWEERWGPLPSIGTLFYIVTEGFGHFTEGFKDHNGKWLKTKADYDREAEEARQRRIQEDKERLEKFRDQWKTDIAGLDEPFR